jgi:hypothetical protein
MTKYALALLSLFINQLAYAQVQNNSFKDRIHLVVDSPLLHSTTAKATVEWECVNKALTNTCLVYHNDQWFYFTLDQAGDYYLNISSQKCRDKRGVQVLIIEGNPCETKDYRILECVSHGLQNDVFVSLQALKAKTPYLINIDGFLGDYCDFNIQIATKPLGLPLHYDRKDTVGVKTIQKGKLVEIRWVVPRERIEMYIGFNVYKKRSEDSRTTMTREVMIERNTYGQPVLHYSFLDTLTQQGNYVYTVFGIQKETLIPIMVSENKVSYFEKKADPKPQSHAIIQIANSMSENFEVMVYDHVNSSELIKYRTYVNPKSARELDVDLSEYIGKGLKSFMVLISDLSTGERKEYYYRLDKSGKLLKE